MYTSQCRERGSSTNPPFSVSFTVGPKLVRYRFIEMRSTRVSFFFLSEHHSSGFCGIKEGIFDSFQALRTCHLSPKGTCADDSQLKGAVRPSASRDMDYRGQGKREMVTLCSSCLFLCNLSFSLFPVTLVPHARARGCFL